jgi:hypothetical protein
MATKLNGAITAANTPTIVFTAYQAFVLRIEIEAGTNVVALQQDLLDDLDWQTTDTFTASGTHIVDVPEGCATTFRLTATTFDTGPVNWAVRGKLNANDTIGGASGGVLDIFEEGGSAVLDEDGTTQLFEEAA